MVAARPTVPAGASGRRTMDGGSADRRLDPAPPAVSAATASGRLTPGCGRTNPLRDPAGYLSSRWSTAVRNLVGVLQPECAFGAQPEWASAVQPNPQRHGAAACVACRATVERSPNCPPHQAQIGPQYMQAK